MNDSNEEAIEARKAAVLEALELRDMSFGIRRSPEELAVAMEEGITAQQAQFIHAGMSRTQAEILYLDSIEPVLGISERLHVDRLKDNGPSQGLER